MPVVLARWIAALQSVVRGFVMLLDVIDAAPKLVTHLRQTERFTCSRAALGVFLLRLNSHHAATWIQSLGDQRPTLISRQVAMVLPPADSSCWSTVVTRVAKPYEGTLCFQSRW